MSSSRPAPPITAQQMAALEAVTARSVRAVASTLLVGLQHVGAADSPWSSKWLALRLAAQQLLEEREASDDPGDIAGTEVARGVLRLMRRLERETSDGAARWDALTRALHQLAAGASGGDVR